MEHVIHTQIDDLQVFDKLLKLKPKYPGPVGWVFTYLKNKYYNEGPNLVVAQGREFAVQRLFGLSNGATSDWTGYKVSHFAVGSGGANIIEGTVDLIGPCICDTKLYSPINLGDSSYLQENSSGDTGIVKPITTDGSLVTEVVSYDAEGGDCATSCAYYTKMKCDCVINANEPTSTVQINEAGLYFVSGTDARMFAHITFSPKFKDPDDVFKIIWYILC